MKKRILLIISGGIAAYKILYFIRRIREYNIDIRVILTSGGSKFITPLSVAAISGNKVYQDLFSLTNEAEMGHINLSRQADILLVAPASANILAKMANGLCDDLATTALLASNKPVVVVPAMNMHMWNNSATRANINILRARNIDVIDPIEGDMACGEYGFGKMAEPEYILQYMLDKLTVNLDAITKQPLLKNKKILITAGPTHEEIDPVRYIANKSSGKQGYAIAKAFHDAGADVILISGPVNLPAIDGIKTIYVETAVQMYDSCIMQLERKKQAKVDIVICSAAVADWRVDGANMQKIKKKQGVLPQLNLVENPDILKTISMMKNNRPNLVIGFAAETENMLENAIAKRLRKNCNWILANDVSTDIGVFGGSNNKISLITALGSEDWPEMTKYDVANKLLTKVEEYLTEFIGE